MKTNKIVPAIKTLLLALILAAGVSYISAWTGPTATAPEGNTDAPVNVGANSQSKLGQLFINTSLTNPYVIGLSVFGKSIFNGGVQITSDSPAKGSVLSATDSNGNATWVATSTLGLGGGTTTTGSAIPTKIQTFTSSGTFTPPAGITRVRVKVWGAGGGGAKSSNGGGGGSGSYSESVVSVTPNVGIPVTIGVGGATMSNTKAGDSSFGGLVTAIGGYSTKTITGGYGGSTASAIGDFKIAGGDGQNGNLNNTGATGDTFYGGTGASAPMGGQGGQAAVGNGNVPGGAGSGGSYTIGANGNFTVVNGGNGANGEVVVEY